MPIVPPAVLYYGPPNMKVNPADIKVISQAEEEMYAETYQTYYDSFYEVMEPEFVEQYPDTSMDAPYNPYVQQPSNHQTYYKPVDPPIKQAVEADSKAMTKAIVEKPAENSIQEAKTPTITPTCGKLSVSSDLQEQALLDEAKHSH